VRGDPGRRYDLQARGGRIQVAGTTSARGGRGEPEIASSRVLNFTGQSPGRWRAEARAPEGLRVGSGPGRPQFIHDIQEGFAAAMVAGMPPPASSSQRFDPFDAAGRMETRPAAGRGRANPVFHFETMANRYRQGPTSSLKATWLRSCKCKRMDCGLQGRLVGSRLHLCASCGQALVRLA
jgi:hypothetical protein